MVGSPIKMQKSSNSKSLKPKQVKKSKKKFKKNYEKIQSDLLGVNF